VTFLGSETIEHLMGLNRWYEILSWTLTGLDPLRLSMNVQVICIVFQIYAKAMLDGSLAREVARERDRPRRLARLMQKLPPEHRPPQKP